MRLIIILLLVQFLFEMERVHIILSSGRISDSFMRMIQLPILSVIKVESHKHGCNYCDCE